MLAHTHRGPMPIILSSQYIRKYNLGNVFAAASIVNKTHFNSGMTFFLLSAKFDSFLGGKTIEQNRKKKLCKKNTERELN